MEHDVASGQMYAYTEIPTTSPPGYRRERLIIPLGLWSFPVDEKPIFPFFVDWALQGGASKPRPSNFLSTGIVDWAGWYLVLSTGLAGSYSQYPAPHVPKKTHAHPPHLALSRSRHSNSGRSCAGPPEADGKNQFLIH